MRSADGHPLPGDDRHLPMASSIDRAIRLSTAAAVLAVAAIAVYFSYGHAYAVVRTHDETGITAWLEAATIDDLCPRREPSGARLPSSRRVPSAGPRRGCWRR